MASERNSNRFAGLKTHRKRQLEERLAVGRAWEDHGLVFTSPIGTALDPRNATREFPMLLKAAGLPVVRFHDLRHTAATLLLAQGVDPRTIMETLGHSQISLTMNTYSHVLPALQAEAAAKVDAVLGTIARDR
jgi:integrase